MNKNGGRQAYLPIRGGVWSRFPELGKFASHIRTGYRTWAFLARAVLVAALGLASLQAHADVQYVYDPAGRLVQVVAPDGTSAVYQYDAAGNILSITQLAAGQLALTTTSTIAAVSGSQITIDGSGFSTTPGDDIVSIGGVEATVVSATGNQLVVDVPAGATTGAISVTVGTNTVTSSQSLTVSSGPSISDFSPTLTNYGDEVTLSGDNLDPQPNGTVLSIGTLGVQPASVSASELTFTAESSGAITVSTPYGRTTSTNELVTLPASVPAASVLSLATLVEGGAPAGLNIAEASSYGVYSFDADIGQYVTIQVDSQTTTPSGAEIGYEVFSPTDTLFASGYVTAASPSIHLPVLVTSGTFVVVFESGSSTSIELSANVQVDPLVSPNGVTSAETIAAAAQSLRFEYRAAVGQSIGIGVTGLTLSPGSPDFVETGLSGPPSTAISDPNCYTYTPGAGCSMYVFNATQAGVYTLELQPSGQQTGTFNLTASQPVTATLALDTPQSVNLSAPGQLGVLTFTATAGQDAAIDISSITTSPANQSISAMVYGPNGNGISGGSGTGAFTINLTNLAAGTYQVVLTPPNGATATLQAEVGESTAQAVPLNGTTANYNIAVPGQAMYYTFSATAGESIGIALTGLTLSPGSPDYVDTGLTGPSATAISEPNCYTYTPGAGCSMFVFNATQAGTYTLEVQPAAQQTGSFNLTASQPVTATLDLDTPQNVSLSAPGQLGVLTFTATAGQDAAIDINSITTSPANQSIGATVYGPSGTEVTGGSGTSAFTINLTNMAAGAYQVVLTPPNGATATLQAEVGESTAQAVPIDGTTTNYTINVPGQITYYTFAATAGESIGIGLTGLTLSPASPDFLGTGISGPSETAIGEPNCYTNTPGAGCSMYVFNAKQAGTYTLELMPAAQQTGSFNLTASQPATAALALDTPQSLNLVAPGQLGVLTFTATAGQDAAIDISSITTSPANQSIGATVYGPSGTEVTGGSGTSAFTINLTNMAAGAYQVVLTPPNGATATLQAEVGESTAQAVPVNGTTTNYTINVPGQITYYTFAATAGESIGIGLTGLTLSPASPDFLGTGISGPSETAIAEPNCYTNTPGAGCSMYVFNAKQAGTYTLELMPAVQQTGSFNLTASQPVTASLALDTPQSVNLSAPGQLGVLTFTATAGQDAAININSITTSPAGQNLSAAVYGPSGTQISSGNGTSTFAINLTNLAAGTYQVVLAPPNGATATLQAEVGESTAQAVPVNGTTTNYTINVPGQITYYTFAATAGESIGIGLTGLTLSPASPNSLGTGLSGPSETTISEPNCYTSTPGAGCSMYVFDATQAGTYTLELIPAVQQTGSFNLTASQPVTASLALDTPQSVNLSAPGQLGDLTFTATSGEDATIDISSITTSPASQSLSAMVYGPSGNEVAGGSGSGAFTISLTNLAAGTYQVLLMPPDGATATATLDVSN